MKKFTSLLLLIITVSVNAQQLPDFNLQVTKTDETCLGNGTLTFTVSDTLENTSLLYKVYLLPDTSNPISVQESTYIGGLNSGVYRVVALQALGNQMNSQQRDITIFDNIQEFAFNVNSSNLNCSQGGNIIVETLSGVAASFEIISGPVTRPLQTSNVFENLPSGSYNVRAFDICGVGKVKSYTLSVVNTTLSISDPIYKDSSTDVCDTYQISNKITPSSGTMTYPLNVKHTLDAMDISGNPIVFNQTITEGPEEYAEVTVTVPRLDESYTYDIAVTDNCNALYEKNGNVIDPDIKVSIALLDATCAEKYLSVTPSRHMMPYTVTFIEPAGFDASLYNDNPNGPFTDDSVVYGSEENPLPFGHYVVEVVDACGRRTTEAIDVEFIKPTPTLKGTNNGCFSEFGKIRVSVPNQKVVSAEVVAAPSIYDNSNPDVTSRINSSGVLVLGNMPLGIYTIKFTDDCGFEYQEDVEVPVFKDKGFDAVTLPSCTSGFGGVRVKGGNGDITAIEIISAPLAYRQQLNSNLPYDVSSYINNEGDLYMADLPAGSYIFRATDICGIVKELAPLNVEGYIAPLNSFVFTPKCGSFSVRVTDSSNGKEGATYWLQKYNEANNTWGHPVSGNVYEEGSLPGTSTGIKLTNNVTKNNLNFEGKFRIVKKFETFATGTSQNNNCISVLGDFTYTDGLSIASAYTMACEGNPNDVYLEAVGHPIAYRIIKKNGVPFLVQNGTNKIFVNLEPAEYVFEVEDGCGNVVTKWFNLLTLPSIADATQPNDMIICAEPGASTQQVFHLTEQNAAILGPLHSAMYTITYHLTQQDADLGVNALDEYYTNISNGQRIFARLVNNHISICHGTTSFRLFVGEYQEPKITTEGTICDGNKLRLTANAGYSSYTWSTGEKTRSIWVSDPGIYTVIVEKAYGNMMCDGFAEVEITESETPTIVKIETSDWTRDQNTITIHTSGNGKYLYSVDDINYQESNVFTNLESGLYQVYVKDAMGCGKAHKEIALLHYPNFFTPNGDGIHDKWQIKYSIKEPNMKIAIFDRYGKLITTFGPTSEGWDGTLNGIQLPSTDYWFVVTREDGREYRGHFSMLR
ncbi:T9SS type B sorting domain-containing protein [Flavobacterium sp. MK4S-17]|uniref:T9SS type B sorting domain-containing protein n=1 Tax=Flavobacterium sp. MK4S-17 TaxID=2543737 RepID=UPI0013570D42|nr:T9SS type B sorting domain-containing protein [Flavobacterium sp. MK4S-17]